MIVGVLEITLHIPDSHSLKEKRKSVRSIKDRIKHKFNVSLAETEGQDTWQRCVLSIAMVASQQTAIEREFDQILRLIEAETAVDLADHWTDYL